MKSPTAARVIGIVPGAGHMYAAEVDHGIAYLGGIAGILFLGLLEPTVIPAEGNRRDRAGVRLGLSIR